MKIVELHTTREVIEELDDISTRTECHSLLGQGSAFLFSADMNNAHTNIPTLEEWMLNKEHRISLGGLQGYDTHKNLLDRTIATSSLPVQQRLRAMNLVLDDMRKEMWKGIDITTILKSVSWRTFYALVGKWPVLSPPHLRALGVLQDSDKAYSSISEYIRNLTNVRNHWYNPDPILTARSDIGTRVLEGYFWDNWLNYAFPEYAPQMFLDIGRELLSIPPRYLDFWVEVPDPARELTYKIFPYEWHPCLASLVKKCIWAILEEHPEHIKTV